VNGKQSYLEITTYTVLIIRKTTQWGSSKGVLKSVIIRTDDDEHNTAGDLMTTGINQGC